MHRAHLLIAQSPVCSLKHAPIKPLDAIRHRKCDGTIAIYIIE